MKISLAKICLLCSLVVEAMASIWTVGHSLNHSDLLLTPTVILQY